MNGKWVAAGFGLILAVVAFFMWWGKNYGPYKDLKAAPIEGAQVVQPEEPQPGLSAYPDALPLGQLPEGVSPTHYAIDLTLVPEADGFEGRVSIDIKVTKPLGHIFLHAEELTFERVQLFQAGAALGDVVAAQEGEDGETRLTLPSEIAPGAYQLRFDYRASYSSELDGIYKVVESGEAYLSSQLETISARRAFPSFDEPRFKVPFDVSVTAQEDDVVVTNTPEISATPAGVGLVRRQFQTTQPLPTYLLAFVVGPYDVEEWTPIAPHGARANPVPLRGIATKGNAERTRQMLSATEVIVHTFEDAFGAPYPFEKLDLIAVPDYAFGAMENAGAIVFREQLVLLDEASPVDSVRQATGVLAHEVAHQWFGDLVTPVWWNDAWLNESFATWAGNIGAAAAQPTFGFELRGRSSGLRVMNRDQRPSVRPVRLPIESNDDIVNAFDGISYSKGAAVLGMFENYVGPEHFMDGVRLHFDRYAFGNATYEKFVSSLADGSGHPEIVAAFDSFILQPGLPKVDFELTCDKEGAYVEAQQSRFSMLGTVGAAPTQWQIPICYRTDKDAACVLMDQEEMRIALGETCPAYFMPNAQSFGYYRWSLDPKALSKLMTSFDALSPIEGESLATNLKAGFYNGAVSFEKLVEMSEVFAASDSAATAAVPISMLTMASKHVIEETNRPKMETLIKDLYGSRMTSLGLAANTQADKEDPAKTATLRKNLAELMAFDALDTGLREQLKSLGEQAIGYGRPKEALSTEVVDLRHLAFAVAVQENGKAYSDALKEAFRESNDGIFRDDILYAWSRVTDSDLAQSLLADVTFADWTRQNESDVLVGRMLDHYPDDKVAWNWLSSADHVRRLALRLPNFARDHVTVLGNTFCDAEDRDAYEALMTSNFDVLDGGPRSLAQGIEQINHCIALKGAIKDDVNSYLAKYPSP